MTRLLWEDGPMPETLQLNYSSQRKENRFKDHPLRRIIIFLAVLIGISIAIAAHSRKEPPRFIATSFLSLFPGS